MESVMHHILAAVRKDVQATNLCSNQVLQFLLGVLAITGRLVWWS